MALLKISDTLAKFPFINRFIAKAATNNLGKDTYQVQILQEFQDKNRKDNQDWRDSLTQADHPANPRWNALQDLYDYIMVDAHTHSLIELRKAATLSTRYYVYDATTGEEQPEKTALLQTEWFYNFLTEVLEARPRGYTVAQLVNPAIMKFDYIPRRNVCIQKNFVRISVTDDKGISLDDATISPFIITIKDNYQYGYMNDLIPLVMWKLNVLMSWAEATEKWGIPPIIATTNKSDAKSIKLLQDMLKNAGESLTTILPEGSNVQVMTNSEKVDPQKMFDGLVERCNSEISKRIIGGTMISDNGSSRSQSETHQSNFDDKIAESDKRKCEFVTTGQLLPMMARFGYPFTETDRFGFDRSQKLSPKEQADIFAIVSKEFDVDEDWVRKNLQIPITGKKQPAATNFNLATNAMAASLVALGVTLPTYTITSCGHAHRFTATGFTDNLLSDLSDILINEIWAGDATKVTEFLIAIKEHKLFTEGLFDGWGERRMQLSYDTPDVRCLAAMEYNLMNFSRAKSKASVLALNQILIDKEKNNVVSFNDFKKLAKEHLTTTNINYLRTEYNHCIAVGQNASRYLQFKDEEDTVTQYVQWQTVGDSNVRLSHAAMNGKIFNLKEKGGLTILPPKDWGCRCELIQFLGKPPKELLYTNEQAVIDLGIKGKPDWNINRAVKEQVFTANEMYLKQSQLSNVDGEMTFKEYGLQPITEMKGLPKLTLDKSINQANAKELFKPVDGKTFMGFTDYLGRKIQLSEKVFSTKTGGHYVGNEELRHQLFPHIKDVLNEPNEVYFQKINSGKYQTTYIKHYDNNSIIINTGVGDNGVDLFTWYPLKDNEEKKRIGYLIYNKKS